MAEITCRIVRPDKLLFEGEVQSIVLTTIDGQMGILPHHASEICALGDGIVRMNVNAETQQTKRFVISGGYAEIDKNVVLVLANHARAIDDIEVDEVQRTKELAQKALEQYSEGDNRRAYYDNKIHWCDLLLAHAHDLD